MSEYTSSSHEPVIHHIHPEDRPASPEDRHQLISLACDNLHCRDEGGIDKPLMNYLGDLQDGQKKSSGYIEDNIAQHAERNYPRLVRLGLIAYMPYQSISIDWHHIKAFACYLDESKTAGNYENTQIEPVIPYRDPSIMYVLRKHDYSDTERRGGAFEAIEDMSNSELESFLDHFAFLFDAVSQA